MDEDEVEEATKKLKNYMGMVYPELNKAGYVFLSNFDIRESKDYGSKLTNEMLSEYSGPEALDRCVSSLRQKGLEVEVRSNAYDIHLRLIHDHKSIFVKQS